MKRAAGHHVVFGVDFEEAEVQDEPQHFEEAPGS